MPSVRKSYDEELLQLDTLLARMGHEAGAAIESALTALRNDDIELARSVVARDSQIDAPLPAAAAAPAAGGFGSAQGQYSPENGNGCGAHRRPG